MSWQEDLGEMELALAGAVAHVETVASLMANYNFAGAPPAFESTYEEIEAVLAELHELAARFSALPQPN